MVTIRQAVNGSILVAALMVGGAFPQRGLAQVPAAAPQTATAATPRALQTKVQPQQQIEAATAVRIVVVEWRIKKGQEQEFLQYWSTRSTVPDRSGLIGEFLSQVASKEQFPWINWRLDPRWTTFYNIGLWRDAADFQEQIGRFIDNSRPPQSFEATKRRRVFLAPASFRIGKTALPANDPPGVQ